MSANYWNLLMGSDEGASSYMLTYGEGPGSALRQYISNLIDDGETVLDVGCGPGWNYDHFMENGPEIGKYKGLDYSDRFVRVANQRMIRKGYASEGLSTYQLGDVRDTGEPDDSWDVVILQDVLEHTNGYETPLREALRVAKRRVLVTFWHLTEDDDHINDDGDDGWGAWYSRPKWETFLDSLQLKWLHDELPRQNGQHDIYIIDKLS